MLLSAAAGGGGSCFSSWCWTLLIKHSSPGVFSCLSVGVVAANPCSNTGAHLQCTLVRCQIYITRRTSVSHTTAQRPPTTSPWPSCCVRCVRCVRCVCGWCASRWSTTLNTILPLVCPGAHDAMVPWCSLEQVTPDDRQHHPCRTYMEGGVFILPCRVA